MRIGEERLALERERHRLDEAGEWWPTRWWRVVLKDGTLWCETSDEAEARERIPKGAKLQHMFQKTKREWRNV
jgi:hypothetical protein